jgi:hypothetical protein
MLPSARTDARRTVHLLSRLVGLARKFNPNHHPAGSPGGIGGQFAAAFDPDNPVPPTPPPEKAELPGVERYWAYFNDAVAELPRATPEFRFAASQTFAFEGGMTSRGEAPVAGILENIWKGARDSGQIPSLTNLSSSSQLTPREAAAIYDWYAGVVLRNAGGRSALAQLGDHRLSAVVFDSVFHHGEGGGARHLRAAVADVFRELSGDDQRLLRDAGFSENTRPGILRTEDMAQIGLLVSRGHARKLLDFVAMHRRTDRVQRSAGDLVRYEHFRFAPRHEVKGSHPSADGRSPV